MMAVYSVGLSLGLLASGSWLAVSRGRKVGYFFAVVGVVGIARTCGLI